MGTKPWRVGNSPAGNDDNQPDVDSPEQSCFQDAQVLEQHWQLDQRSRHIVACIRKVKMLEQEYQQAMFL
jgi:hypothetical protein